VPCGNAAARLAGPRAGDTRWQPVPAVPGNDRTARRGAERAPGGPSSFAAGGSPFDRSPRQSSTLELIPSAGPLLGGECRLTQRRVQKSLLARPFSTGLCPLFDGDGPLDPSFIRKSNISGHNAGLTWGMGVCVATGTKFRRPPGATDRAGPDRGWPDHAAPPHAVPPRAGWCRVGRHRLTDRGSSGAAVA
jgi:hypothetical protein